MVGNQKLKIVEITIGIMFLFEISIHYLLYREFSPKKNYPLHEKKYLWVGG